MVAVVMVAGCGSAMPPTDRPSRRAEPIDGASFTVEPPMAGYIGELDEREQREQVRDWAVLGTVAHLGATPEQAAAATYELPPARLPYLDGLYSFEYGRGRRAYLGTRVLLFRDADDPDPQATLGRLADRVRMENGELPATVEVYLINDQRDLGTIRVDRGDDATRDDLFSPIYGYVQGEVGDAASLTAWLAKVDDLTFARIGDNGYLVLGGRRFPKTRTASLTTEDVAALYQAHEELDKPRAKARQQLATLSAVSKAAAEHAIELAHNGDYAAWQLMRREAWRAAPYADKEAALQAIDELSRPVESPGFSLDPEWLPDPEDPRHPLILARIRAFANDPCRELRSIMQLADTLEREQREDSRTARAMSAIEIRKGVGPEANLSAELCLRLKQTVAPRLSEIAAEVAPAPPPQWDRALTAYHQLIKDVQDRLIVNPNDPTIWLTYRALKFYSSDMRVQCGR
jgi:hypothetical protein